MALPDLAVAPVDIEFRAPLHRHLARPSNRLGLSFECTAGPFRAGRPHAPTVTMGHDMLSRLRHGDVSSEQQDPMAGPPPSSTLGSRGRQPEFAGTARCRQVKPAVERPLHRLADPAGPRGGTPRPTPPRPPARRRGRFPRRSGRACVPAPSGSCGSRRSPGSPGGTG